MTFSHVGERTVVRHAYSTSPLMLLNPQNHSAAAWVYLASYGGGLVGGDALRIDIDVQRGAAAVISTQASTKIHRSAQGASQQVRGLVADDALLDVAGGDKIPRKGGRGITQSDLLVINKTDLAPLMGADLSVMDRDAYKMRSGGQLVFAQATHDVGVDAVDHILNTWRAAL
jgi:hypothetical protein